MTDITSIAQRMREAAERAQTACKHYERKIISATEFQRLAAEFHRMTDSPEQLLTLLDALAQRDEQLARVTDERDALREAARNLPGKIRAAADIYFQLVDECEIPRGGSLVQYVEGLKEQIAALSGECDNIRAELYESENQCDDFLERAEKAEAQLAELEDVLDTEIRCWTQRYDYANSRANAAEKRVAELAAQEPYGYTTGKININTGMASITKTAGEKSFPLYRAAPPVPVKLPEWTDQQCLEFISIAFRHAEISGDIKMDDIRLGMKIVNAGVEVV